MRKIVICIAVVAVLLTGYQVLRIFIFGGKVTYHNPPYEQNNPQADLKILFLGDSTAVGTGALDNRESTAGWFGQDFPKAHITNISRNGQRLAGLLESFPAIETPYTLVILQIGANDIMRFTPLKNVERDLSELIDKAKAIGRQVVILHSGNVGTAPIFSWPFSEILTGRTRAIRDLYIKTAAEKDVLYVYLFQERKDDIFLTDIHKFYAPDLLHPNGAGYRVWYDKIRKVLNDANEIP